MWISKERFEVLIRAETEAAGLRQMVERLESSLTLAYAARDQERQRSDEAVDKMLQVKGLPSVSPTEKPPTLEQLTAVFEEDPAEVREITRDIKERGAETVLLKSE